MMNTNTSKTIYLYVSALCNLKCSYCYISKNKELLEIDKMIDESFQKEHFYLNLAKKYLDNNLDEIDTLEFWGAEPTLGLHRITNTLKDYIENCKNLKTFIFSTNCTTSKTISSIKNFLDTLSLYPNRNFNLDLQISVDGPEEFTDVTRGKGTTAKIVKTFNELIDSNILLSYPNVTCKIHFKPTLDLTTLKLLQTKEKNIEYYQWFETTFYDKLPKELYIYCSTPNLAVPSPYTSEDGKLLAKIMKIQCQIDIENISKKYFKYFKSIMLFNYGQKMENLNSSDMTCSGGFCSAGLLHIGFLPNGSMCGCHRIFTNFIESYTHSKNEINNSTTFIKNENRAINGLISNTYEEFKNHERKMRNFYFLNNYDKDQIWHQFTSLKATITNQVLMLAATNQILPKYKHYNEAVKVANFFVNSRYPICQHANLTMSGINTCIPLSELRLFCNGAIDLILKRWQERNLKEERINNE